MPKQQKTTPVVVAVAAVPVVARYVKVLVCYAAFLAMDSSNTAKNRKMLQIKPRMIVRRRSGLG